MADGNSVTIVAILGVTTAITAMIAGVTFYNTQELNVINSIKDDKDSCTRAVYMMNRGTTPEETTKQLAICRGYQVKLPTNDLTK